MAVLIVLEGDFAFRVVCMIRFLLKICGQHERGVRDGDELQVASTRNYETIIARYYAF